MPWKSGCGIQRKKILPPQNIKYARNVFSKLPDSNAKEKSYSLYLQAIWHFWGVIHGKPNYLKAVHLFNEAIKFDNAEAMHHRASMHELGLGNAVDLAEAINLYEKAISLGSTNAMVNRAVIYQLGRGVEKDAAKAIELYDKAIELDNPSAMNNRALMHQFGVDCEKNLAKAIELYDKAIELDNAEAMFIKGLMYQYGWNCEKNLTKAIELYDRAIELGNEYAMTQRALMYQNGWGCNKNYVAAIELYEMAIDLDHSDAMNYRALMYQNGWGSKINYKEAAMLYDRAIPLGHTNAMWNRGHIYEHGLDGNQNYLEAIRLYNQSTIVYLRANELEDNLAKKNLERFLREIKLLELLKNALQGEESALEEWLQYSDKKKFTLEDIKNAQIFFNKLSDSTNLKEKSYSLYLQAVWYHKGVIGVVDNKRDYLKAISLYDGAIKLDNIYAMYNKAYMHQQGEGCEKNKDKSIELFDRGIKLKSAKAMNAKAFIYFLEGRKAQEPIKLFDEARDLFNQAIQLNYSQAMYNRANMHECCKEEDPNVAIKLYRMASQLGHPLAKRRLAQINDSFLKDALQGQASALEKWSQDSRTKSFTPQEIDQATEVFSNLSDSKEKSYGLYLQALWHYWGVINGEANYSEAIRLYEEAIKLENADAMNNRAMMYLYDSDLKEYYDEAINLLDEATRLDNASAMNNRAYMYEYGLREKDSDKAMALYHRAFDLGYAPAKQNLERLRGKIEESYKDTIRAIEKTLDTFKKEIAGIHPHFLEAKNKVEELFSQLIDYKDAYREALLTSSRKEVEIIGKQFKKNCQDAIAQARPLLERDLGWGDYLINLLKALVNAVMKGATLGQVNPNSLFTYKKAELVGVVEKAELNLGFR